MSSLLALSVLVFCMTIGFVLRQAPGLPSYATYAPDLLIAGAAAIVVVRLIATQAWARIPLKYVLVFAAFLYVVVAGIVMNDVSGDTAFAGLRIYLKYVPLFLIPFAFRFSDRSILFQLQVLFLIMVIQIPVTVWQRFFLFSHLETGDYISGTLTNTSSIAIIATSAIVMVAAFYIDKRISLRTALLLGLTLLIPAGLSETKATPFMLGLGGIGLLFLRRKVLDRKLLTGLAVSGALILGVFVMLYDLLYAERWDRGFAQQVTATDRMLEGYNLKGVRGESFARARPGTHGIVGVIEELKDSPVPVGRFDTVRLPFDVLFPDEPMRLLMGLGVGNVDSSFGSGGDYLNIKDELGASQTTFAMFIWETGVIGTLLYLLFLVLVARDALALSGSRGLPGTIAAGQFGITLILGLSLIYANFMHLIEVPALFSYFAGIVAARQAELRRTVTRPQPHRRPRAFVTHG